LLYSYENKAEKKNLFKDILDYRCRNSHTQHAFTTVTEFTKDLLKS